MTPDDRLALLTQVRPFVRRLARNAARKLGAGDVEGAFLFAVWRYADHFDPARVSQLNFAFGMCRMVYCSPYWRRWARLRAIDAEVLDLIPGRSNTTPDPADDAERREAVRLALAAVARLPERERLVVELRFGLNGRRQLPAPEIAEAIGLSESQAKAVLRSALAKVAAAVGADPDSVKVVREIVPPDTGYKSAGASRDGNRVRREKLATASAAAG